MKARGTVVYKEIRESTGNVESEEPDSKSDRILNGRKSLPLARRLLIGGAAVAGGLLLLLLLYVVYRRVRSA